jgi:N-acetylglucosamine malate deacetylase 2
MQLRDEKFGKVLVFVAHPDDESIGCSGLLQRADSSRVVFAVDAAPPHYGFEQKFGSLPTYSDIRFVEASRALACVPQSTFRRLTKPDQSYFQDQHLFLDLPAAYASLKQRILEFSPDLMITHACEGGHIDHDACHFLAAWAASELGCKTWEFPLYWRTTFGRNIFQRFRSPLSSEVLLTLSQAERNRKKLMLSQYPTQNKLTSVFQLDSERFRPPSTQKYERLGWRNYAFENRRWGLKVDVFLQKIAEFERSFSIPRLSRISSGPAWAEFAR